MAVCFVGPVGDAKEVSLRAGAIPNNTKATIQTGVFMSGMCEWTGSRAMKTVGVDEIFH